MHTKNVRLVSFNLEFRGFWTTFYNQISTEQGSRRNVSIRALFLVIEFQKCPVSEIPSFWLNALLSICAQRYALFVRFIV